MPCVSLPAADDLFAYTTAKVVRIRDWRLGVLHYSFMLMVLLYVVIYVIWYQGRYMATSAPLNSTRFQLKAPLPTDTNHLCQRNGTLAYYCNRGPGFSFCGPANKQPPCIYLDEYSVVHPLVENNAVFLTTRLTMLNQNLTAPPGEIPSFSNIFAQWYPPYTDSTSTSDSGSYYIAGFGNFTALIDHQVFSSVLSVQTTNSKMNGELMRCNTEGDGCSNWSNYSAVKSFSRTADILTMEDILAATTSSTTNSAGVNLDSLSDAAGSAYLTTRFVGSVITCYIRYDNTGTLIKGSSSDNIMYQYFFRQVPNSKFKTVEAEAVGSVYSKSRLLLNRHGLRIIVIPIGLLGKFDFQSLLVQLTTSLALLAISTTIVDLFLQYIMPQRKIYSSYKVLVTEDIHTLEKESETEGKEVSINTDASLDDPYAANKSLLPR